MSDFYTYVLEKAPSNALNWHPYDEVLMMMLSFLPLIYRHQDEELIITTTHLLVAKRDEVSELMGIARYERVEPDAKAQRKSTSFRDAMRLLVEHDERIRQHFQLVEELPESVTYKIIQDPQ